MDEDEAIINDPDLQKTFLIVAVVRQDIVHAPGGHVRSLEDSWLIENVKKASAPYPIRTY